MKSGTLLRQVINRLNEGINFNRTEDRHLFGDSYEQILRDLQSAGNAGEYNWTRNPVGWSDRSGVSTKFLLLPPQVPMRRPREGRPSKCPQSLLTRPELNAPLAGHGNGNRTRIPRLPARQAGVGRSAAGSVWITGGITAWTLTIRNPETTVCLQAVDYFLWALKRLDEPRCTRPFHGMANTASSPWMFENRHVARITTAPFAPGRGARSVV
jgi:hypothetical protein